MKYIKTLQILFDQSIETYNSITELLGINPTINESEFDKDNIPNVWSYEVEEKEEDPYFDFINIFCDILENKYDKLATLGIQKDDILFWDLYEYDQQCNMEFDPERMKRLGDNGISLCISCWESGEEYNSQMKETEVCCICGESVNIEDSAPLSIPIDKNFNVSQILYSHKQCLKKVLNKKVVSNLGILEDDMENTTAEQIGDC